MPLERTSYLSDEEIDRRAEFKIDASSYDGFNGWFGAFVKRRWWVFSWWEEVFTSRSLEACTEYLQQRVLLPRRFTRKMVLQPREPNA